MTPTLSDYDLDRFIEKPLNAALATLDMIASGEAEGCLPEAVDHVIDQFEDMHPSALTVEDGPTTRNPRENA